MIVVVLHGVAAGALRLRNGLKENESHRRYAKAYESSYMTEQLAKLVMVLSSQVQKMRNRTVGFMVRRCWTCFSIRAGTAHCLACSGTECFQVREWLSAGGCGPWIIMPWNLLMLVPARETTGVDSESPNANLHAEETYLSSVLSGLFELAFSEACRIAQVMP